MPTIAFVNIKGGVGKTSSCFHLAGVLARRGRRVLLVDADPQASLSMGFLPEPEVDAMPPEATIAAVLAGDEPDPSAVIRATAVPGVDLLVGSDHAARYNVPIPNEAPYEAQVALREFLDEVDGRHDLVLVDCPPTLSGCTWNAMAAASRVVVPLQAEDFGAQGLNKVHRAINAVRSSINPGLGVLGYLLTMTDSRWTLHRAYGGMLRDVHGGRVFEATIPRLAEVAESVSHHKPVAFYKPSGQAAAAFGALADEFLGRLAEGELIPREEEAA